VPTVLRINGFDVRILTNDHKPAHIHAFKAGTTAKVEIADPVPVVRKTTMSMRDTDAIVEVVHANLTFLQLQWNYIHGPLR
jgi:Domain of unknown function (DUF4160)